MTAQPKFLSQFKNLAISRTISQIPQIAKRQLAAMKAMKNVRQTTRLLFAWFVLSMGVAVLAPWMNVEAMSQVCGSTGEMYVAEARSQESDDSGPIDRTWNCVFCWAAQITAPISTAIHAIEWIPAICYGKPEVTGQPFARFRTSFGARAPPVGLVN